MSKATHTPFPAVLFDAYGTLFDVYSVTERARSFYGDRAEALSLLWRDKQLEYSRLRSMSGRYVPFWQVTSDALSFALEKLGLEETAAARDGLMDAYDHLQPFGEVGKVLEQLSLAGVRLGILSNGDLPMLDRVLRNSALKDRFEFVLSADTVERFKTAPELYALGPQSLGLPAERILFVSSNGWDACAARWYGYTTFWVNRQRAPAERLGVAPSASGATLADAARYALPSLSFPS